MSTDTGQIDPVSGALMRAAFAPQLEQAMMVASASRRPLALCMIDLDHFKSVNDAFGHLRGDEVLRSVAARIHSSIRAGDVLFRYGGDEFALLLPGCAEEQAAALAARILEQVRSQPLPGQPPVSVTLSIGVAALDAGDTDASDLIERADARAFAAKRTGRGKVVVADIARDGTLHFDAQSRLLARDAASARILAFLSDTLAQGRGLLTVHGAPGSGRSSMLQAAARMAELRGFMVVRLAGKAVSRNRMLGALLESGDTPPAVAAAGHEPEAAAAALAMRVLDAGRTTLFLAVDDLEELDAATVRVLGLLLSDSRLAAVAVALAQETEISARGALHAPVTATVETTRFSEHDTKLWLRGVLAAEPPDAFVAWLHAACDGLPGRLVTMVRQLSESGQLRFDAGEWRWQGPDHGAAIATAAPPHARLPGSWDTFVGRVAELQRVKDMVEPRAVVTVVGPAGAGKTRLATQAAREIATRFSHGVAFVALAGLEDAGQCALAIASALDLGSRSSADPAGAVLDYLATKSLLLVLDDVAPTAAWSVVAGMRGLPNLALLLTARAPLQIPGERLQRLSGLELPADAEHLAGVASVQLLVQRIQATQPGWEPSHADLRDLARICHGVEGMPLGLEMAAAWIPALGCADVASLVAGGSAAHDHARRHNLLDVVAAFWSELGEMEQGVLRLLTLFRGGFSGRAAQQVAGASRFLLAALVDRGFVRRSGDGRYYLHELLRQYGAGQLAEREEDRLRGERLHLAQCLELAREMGLHSHQPLDSARLAVLEVERENLRAAVESAVEDPAQWRDGLELAMLLERFWRERGPLAEGYATVARALANYAERDALRANALRAAGTLALFAGDLPEARAHLEQAAALAGSLDDRTCLALASTSLGLVLSAQGDPAAAIAAHERSLSLGAEVGDQRAQSLALNNLGLAAWRLGDLGRAESAFRQCLAIERALDDRGAVAGSLDNLGCLQATRGDDSAAGELFEEALAMHRARELPQGIARSLANLAELALRRGDSGTAGSHYRESLGLCLLLGNSRAMVARIEGIAAVCSEEGAWSRAATLFAAAAAWRLRLGAPPTEAESRAIAARCADAREALGEAAYVSAWTVGYELTGDDAVAIALSGSRTACIA